MYICIHKDKYTNEKLYNINNKSKCKQRYSSIFHASSSIKNHQSFSPFLVHYSVQQRMYPHSLHVMGSLDFISCSLWRSPQICITGCCLGGIVSPHIAWRNSSPCTSKWIAAPCCVAAKFPIFNNHVSIDFSRLCHQIPFLIKHQRLSPCDEHRETLFKVGEHPFTIEKANVTRHSKCVI